MNIKNGETLSYPLCYLRITSNEGVVVKNLSDENDNSKTLVPNNKISNAFMYLQEGDNQIEVSTVNSRCVKVVRYSPLRHNRILRLLYITPVDDDGIQAPNGQNTQKEAIRRIQIGSLVLQSYLAESLKQEGLGRRTFQLEFGKDGLPKVRGHLYVRS